MGETLPTATPSRQPLSVSSARHAAKQASLAAQSPANAPSRVSTQALKGRQITGGGKQRVAPGHESHNNSSFIIPKSSLAMRVLEVVEVLVVLDFLALLALKGRQITGGGKQRVAPDLQ